MVGTFRYAAPERLMAGPATERSDVWALGAVLYEMLTGHPAIGTDDPAAALAVRSDPPAVERLPPAIGAVIIHAMAPSPADRYSDAAALRDALDGLDGPVAP